MSRGRECVDWSQQENLGTRAGQQEVHAGEHRRPGEVVCEGGGMCR